MAEGQEPTLEPSINDSGVKSFTANASPPGGNCPKNSGNQSDHSSSGQSEDRGDDTGANVTPGSSVAGHTIEKESGIEESQREGGDEMIVGLPSQHAPLQVAPDPTGPTVVLSNSFKWNISMTRCKFKKIEALAGDPEVKVKMDTEVRPYRSKESTGYSDSELWTQLDVKLTINSSHRRDYHYKAQVKASLYDRQAGRYLCVEKKAQHNIPDNMDFVQFSMDLAPQTAVESSTSKELEIHVKVEVTSQKVGFRFSNYNFRQDEAYVNIDRD